MHAEELYESEICWFDNPMSFGKALSLKNPFAAINIISSSLSLFMTSFGQFDLSVYFESCVYACWSKTLTSLPR